VRICSVGLQGQWQTRISLEHQHLQQEGTETEESILPERGVCDVEVACERGCTCVCMCVRVTVLGFVIEGGLEMSRCFKCLIFWFTCHECIVH